MRAARSWKCRGQGRPVFAAECSPQVRGLAFPKSEPFRGQGHHPAVRPVLPLDPGRMRAVRASPSQPCTSQLFSHFLLARNLFFFFFFAGFVFLHQDPSLWQEDLMKVTPFPALWQPAFPGGGVMEINPFKGPGAPAGRRARGRWFRGLELPPAYGLPLEATSEDFSSRSRV